MGVPGGPGRSLLLQDGCERDPEWGLEVSAWTREVMEKEIEKEKVAQAKKDKKEREQAFQKLLQATDDKKEQEVLKETQDEMHLECEAMHLDWQEGHIASRDEFLEWPEEHGLPWGVPGRPNWGTKDPLGTPWELAVGWRRGTLLRSGGVGSPHW